MPLRPGMGGLAAELQQAAKTAAQPPAPLVPEDGVLHAGMGPGGKGARVHVCSKDDTLRTVVERLATPGEFLGRTGRWFGEDNWCHVVCWAPVSRGSWCAGCMSGYGRVRCELICLHEVCVRLTMPLLQLPVAQAYGGWL